MQVLMRRRIKMSEPSLTPVRFVLWVKFDVNKDESALITRYFVEPGYITIERRREDFYRAFIYALIISVVVTSIFENFMLITIARDLNLFQHTGAIVLAVFFGCLALATWLLYEQFRFAIRVSDMLEGREFKHKSLALMARRERQMIGYAVCFKQFLEKLKEWEGTEVITLGEEHEPALRLVTDYYAAA